MNVYFISGLGADRSIFKYIKLPPGHEAVHLDWIPPLPGETLAGYALRLARKIDLSTPFSLVGLSFGGMIAVEIAKKTSPLFTIIISSIPSIAHLPGYFRIAGRLRLHKLIPVFFIQRAAILKRFFTTETPADKKQLKAMIRNSDARFIKWAMHAILTWDNTGIPAQLIHIHGAQDKILPRRYTQPTHTISGGHLMVLNRAEEINAVLCEVLVKAE